MNSTVIAKPQQAAFGMALRPYQREAQTAINIHAAQGDSRQLIVLPTGAGKTVLFAGIIAERPGRALVLAHRQELIEQAATKLSAMISDRTVGIVQGERDDTDADIVVASVPTLAALQGRRLLSLPETGFSTVVVDEAHHATAPSYRAVLDHVGPFEGDRLALGFTATPNRADGQGLASIFPTLSFERDLIWAIEEGYCCDLTGLRVELAADLHTISLEQGDFDAAELASVLERGNAPEVTAEAVAAHCPLGPTLVFCASVALSEQTALALKRRGVAAAHIDGDTAPSVRRDILRQLADGTIKALCNCSVLTEGFDEPSIRCVVVARPTLSSVLYTQMVGRGLRPYLNKETCIVIDVVGATEHVELQTVASLTGTDASGNSLRAQRQQDLERALAWDGSAPLSAYEISLLDAHWRKRHRNFHPKWEWRSWTEEGNGSSEIGGIYARHGGKAAEADAWVAKTPSGRIIIAPQRHELSGFWGVMVATKVGGAEVFELLYPKGPNSDGSPRRGLPIELAFGVASDWIRENALNTLLIHDPLWRKLPTTFWQRVQLGLMGKFLPGPKATNAPTRGDAAVLLSRPATLGAARRGGKRRRR